MTVYFTHHIHLHVSFLMTCMRQIKHGDLVNFNSACMGNTQDIEAVVGTSDIESRLSRSAELTGLLGNRYIEIIFICIYIYLYIIFIFMIDIILSIYMQPFNTNLKIIYFVLTCSPCYNCFVNSSRNFFIIVTIFSYFLFSFFIIFIYFFHCIIQLYGCFWKMNLLTYFYLL